MRDYAKLYHSYNLPILKLIRFLVLIFFVWVISMEYTGGSTFWKIPTVILSFFLIFEVYFRFKVSKISPFVEIGKNDGSDIYKSFTLKSMEIIAVQNKVSKVIHALLKEDSVKFILKKADIKDRELPVIEVSKDEISKTTFSIVKEINGKFVTTADLFVSYVLLIEEQTKLLFSKKLKTEEFLHILKWARFNYQNEENPKPLRVNFWGEGIGEGMVYGWTIETKKYTKDLTPKALSQKRILLGREKEYRETIEFLSKPEKNNIILVGDVGSGKTELVETLAFDSFIGNLQGLLYHKRFFELMSGSLIAGVSNTGELENRIQSIVEEIAHCGNVIIYISEFQDIVGASGLNLDLSGSLLPYLKNGNIQIVASVTPGSYKRFIEPRREILDVFEVVKLEEADSEKAMAMLLEKAERIESKNKVDLTYRAISAALNFSQKYVVDRVLPGSAVILLEDAASKAILSGKKKVEEKDVLQVIEQKSNVPVSSPTASEKELLLHLEDKIHERVIDQTEGVGVIAEAMRRFRTGLVTSSKPISFLFLGPTGVGKTETAKALSAIYFKSEDRMIRLDMSEYSSNDSLRRLLGSAPGEGMEKGELTEKIYENPFSLVLLDEFEKASPQIHNLFLQVLDDGRLTDNKGKTVSFADAIIIATSNAGSEFIREEIQKGTVIDKAFQQKLLDLLQSQGIFKPELLNRFDGIVAFKPIGQAEAVEITKIALNKVAQKLLEQDITVQFDEKIIQKIVTEGMNVEFGARPLNRYIQDNIEDLISQKILKDEIKRGNKIIISVDEENNIIVSPRVIPAEAGIQ